MLSNCISFSAHKAQLLLRCSLLSCCSTFSGVHNGVVQLQADFVAGLNRLGEQASAFSGFPQPRQF